MFLIKCRRRSDLIIKSAVASDSGRYECRAKNKLIKKPVSKIITLTVSSPTNDRTSKFSYAIFHQQRIISSNIAVKLINEGKANECPPEFDGYCANNGTCWYVKVFEEASCK